jgi:hypothetical protein
MEWKTERNGEGANRGDIKFVWRFAWWPQRCADGITRWLETVTVKQVFTDVWVGGMMYDIGWKSVEVYAKNYFDQKGDLPPETFQSPTGQLGQSKDIDATHKSQVRANTRPTSSGRIVQFSDFPRNRK